MKVLVVNENRGFGGGEVHTLQCARALAARGHEVRLGVRRGSWLEARVREAGLPLHLLPMANEVDPVTMTMLAFLVRRHGIDVVHCHATRDMVLAAGARRFFPRTGVVKTEHTFVGGHLSGVCRQAYHTLDRVICVSRALQDQVTSHLGLPRERCPIVHNGLDPRHAAPGHARLSLLDQGRWVGVIGSLLDIKGQRYLLQAAPRILERFPDVRFLIAGEGPERAALEEQAQGLPVDVVGFLADPLDALAGLTVAVVPSTVETFSLVSLEAMALARPLVASRVGGVPEVVEDGVTGTLVPPADPAALAEAVCAYLADPDLAARHGEAGRRRAVELFTQDRMAERLEAVYAEVLQERRP